MKKRIEELEAQLQKQQPSVAAAAGAAVGAEQPQRTLLATVVQDPAAIPVVTGTLRRRDDKTLVASNATMSTAPSGVDPAPQAGKAAVRGCLERLLFGMPNSMPTPCIAALLRVARAIV